MPFTIRRLVVDELDTVSRMRSCTFHYAYRPSDEPGDPEYAACSWGAFDGKRMVANLSAPIRKAFVGGRAIQCGAVEGVISLPETRRKGAVRGMFAAMMRAQKDVGVALSALYPFSYSYYRAFGYERPRPAWEVAVQPKALEHLPFGNCRAVGVGEDLMAAQSAFARARNLCFLRDEKRWRNLVGTPETSLQQAYVYDEDGAPAGYFILDGREAWGQPRTLTIREFAATTPRAVWQMLGFLRHFAPQADRFLFVNLPDGLPFWESLDPHLVTATQKNGPMARFLDPQLAFACLAYAGDGALTLGLTDPMLEENNGTWRLVWQGGVLQSALPTDAPADAVVSMQQLSQWVLGGASTDTLALCDLPPALLPLLPTMRMGLMEVF